MTQQHYREREKHKTEAPNPPKFLTATCLFIKHDVSYSPSKADLIFNCLFLFHGISFIVLSRATFDHRRGRSKNAIAVITFRRRVRALRHSILFSPHCNWLICSKQISPLWRFMVHRKLNWCLFSAKLLNITGGGISGSACWETPGGGSYTSRAVFVSADERAQLVGPHVHLASPHLDDRPAIGFERPLIQFHSLGRLSFMPFSCPPIKNAPQGLVGGRWEWRSGSFQRSPSIIQRAVWFC